MSYFFFFFFQAEDGIRDRTVTGVQTCALPISNTGTLRKSAGINTTTLAAGTTFINNGTVEVESGTLAFMNGGVFVTGSVLSRGGLVQLKAGTFMIGAATVTSTNVQLVGGTRSGVIRGVLDWGAGNWV